MTIICASAGCENEAVFEGFCDSCNDRFFKHKFVENYELDDDEDTFEETYGYTRNDIEALQHVGYDLSTEIYNEDCACDLCWIMRDNYGWYSHGHMIYDEETLERHHTEHRNPEFFTPIELPEVLTGCFMCHLPKSARYHIGY